jgi:C4-dicarboxylate-specific signal transduction histidine kinase
MKRYWIFSKPKLITQKMLTAIFLVSSLVTFAITTIQLSFDYFQEMSSLNKNLDLIQKSYSKSIATSLWQLSLTELQTHIDGILSVPGILNVQVIEKNKVVAKAGNFAPTKTLVRSFNLSYYDDNKSPIYIGKLVVAANVDEVLGKIFNKIIIIFITQFIKTLLVSFFIYLCIKHLITRHLTYITKYLAELQLGAVDKQLTLDRKTTADNDELDTLVYSINDMREKVNQSYSALTLLNKELEEKVETKTQLIIEQRLKLEYSAKMSTLGEMAGGIAHEINNPITIISAITRILRKTTEKGINDPKIMNKCFDDIDNTVLRISKIITGLRIVSRDGSNDEFKNEKIGDIFNDVLSLCGEKFKSNGVDIQADLTNSVYQNSVNCSRVQLSQVFLNLLGNSYDAIEELPEKWIKIDCEKSDGKLILRFTDSGLGISEEIQKKFLQPFFTTKAIGKGTGLGLSISNSIIKIHSGDFSIDNDSKNTCFVITLPVST